MTVHFPFAAKHQDSIPDTDDLSSRAAELERQADEQLLLFELTANGYMQRLHRQLSESLRLEAAALRQRRTAMRRR